MRVQPFPPHRLPPLWLPQLLLEDSHGELRHVLAPVLHLHLLRLQPNRMPFRRPSQMTQLHHRRWQLRQYLRPRRQVTHNPKSNLSLLSDELTAQLGQMTLTI